MNEITETNFSEAAAPLLVLHDSAHTEVQIDYFIIGCGGEGHPWGMFRQAMRELESRQSMLVGVVHTRALLRLIIEEHDIAIEEMPTSATHRPTQIARERRQLERAHDLLKLAADDARVVKNLQEGRQIMLRVRELRDALVAENGELTPDVCRRLDEEFWVHSFRQRLALCTIAGAPMPRDIVTVLPLLPPRMRDPVLQALATPADNLDSFGFFKGPSLALKGTG